MMFLHKPYRCSVSKLRKYTLLKGVKYIKTIRKAAAFIFVFSIFFALTACSGNNNINVAAKARVIVVSGGNEHEALRHWNHGFSPEMNASGWFKRAEEVADELTAFIFNDDFQIIIEGELWRSESYYYFYQLTDGEWLKVLAVFNRPEGQEVYMTHGETWNYEYWVSVTTHDFWELLQPGDYILDVGGWWGNSESADSYNNFFRFIK